MNRDIQVGKARAYMNTICAPPHRRTGSAGNRTTVDFFAGTIGQLGYATDTTPFPCLDHETGAVSLTCGERDFEVFISPYSPPVDAEGRLAVVSSIEELADCECHDKIILLHGAIAAEQLMPKHFTFYNPELHQRIYALLETKRPAAIITATAHNPEAAGALYPFPMIEDGDFDIPSVYCADTTGEAVARHSGELFRITIEAQCITSSAANVVARKNLGATAKVVVCAHIDTKETTPGAIDNAAGVATLLLLAEMLKDYTGLLEIEFAAINGEDNYSAAGEMDYLRRYGDSLPEVLLAVNIDAAGYIEGRTCLSFYNLPSDIEAKAREVIESNPGLVEGAQWYQSDHMVFVQAGRPAIAVTSERFADLCATITHTPKDTPDIVDTSKVVDLAAALNTLIRTL